MSKHGSQGGSDKGSSQGSEHESDRSSTRSSDVTTSSGSDIGNVHPSVSFPGGPSATPGRNQPVQALEVEINERLGLEFHTELLSNIKQTLINQRLGKPDKIASLVNTPESTISMEQALDARSQLEKEVETEANKMYEYLMQIVNAEHDPNRTEGKNTEELIRILQNKVHKKSALTRAKRKIIETHTDEETGEDVDEEVIQEGYYFGVEEYDPISRKAVFKHYFWPSTDETKFAELLNVYGLKTSDTVVHAHEAQLLNENMPCEEVDDMFKTIVMSFMNATEALKGTAETGSEFHQFAPAHVDTTALANVAGSADIFMVATLYCRAQQFKLAQREREEANRMQALAEQYKTNPSVAAQYREAEMNLRKKAKYNCMSASVGLGAAGSYLGSGAIEIAKEMSKASIGTLGTTLGMIAPGLMTILQIGVLSVKQKKHLHLKGEIEAAETSYKYFANAYPSSNPEWQAFAKSELYRKLVAEPNLKKNPIAQEMNLDETELQTLVSLHQQQVLGEKLSLFFWGEKKPELRTVEQSIFINSVELALSTVGTTHAALTLAGAGVAAAGVGTVGFVLIPVALASVIVGTVSYYKAKKLREANVMTEENKALFAQDDSFPRMMAQLYEAVKMEQITYAQIEQSTDKDKIGRPPQNLSYQNTSDKSASSGPSISAPFNVAAKGIRPFSNMVELCLGMPAADFIKMVEYAIDADDKLELERLHMNVEGSKRQQILQNQRAIATTHALISDRNPQVGPPVVQYAGIDGKLIEIKTNSLQYSAFSKFASTTIKEAQDKVLEKEKNNPIVQQIMSDIQKELNIKYPGQVPSQVLKATIWQKLKTHELIQSEPTLTAIVGKEVSEEAYLKALKVAIDEQRKSNKVHAFTKNYHLGKHMEAEILREKYQVNYQAAKYKADEILEEVPDLRNEIAVLLGKNPDQLTDLQIKMKQFMLDLLSLDNLIEALHEQFNSALTTALNALDEWVETGAIVSKFYQTRESEEKKIKSLFDIVEKNRCALDKQIKKQLQFIKSNTPMVKAYQGEGTSPEGRMEERQKVALLHDERSKRTPSSEGGSSQASTTLHNILNKGSRYLKTHPHSDRQQLQAEEIKRRHEMYRQRQRETQMYRYLGDPKSNPNFKILQSEVEKHFKRFQTFFNQDQNVLYVQERYPNAIQEIRHEIAENIKTNLGNLDDMHRALLKLIIDLEKPSTHTPQEMTRAFFFDDPTKSNLIVQCKQMANEVAALNLFSDSYKAELSHSTLQQGPAKRTTPQSDDGSSRSSTQQTTGTQSKTSTPSSTGAPSHTSTPNSTDIPSRTSTPTSIDTASASSTHSVLVAPSKTSTPGSTDTRPTPKRFTPPKTVAEAVEPEKEKELEAYLRDIKLYKNDLSLQVNGFIKLYYKIPGGLHTDFEALFTLMQNDIENKTSKAEGIKSVVEKIKDKCKDPNRMTLNDIYQLTFIIQKCNELDLMLDRHIKVERKYQFF